MADVQMVTTQNKRCRQAQLRSVNQQVPVNRLTAEWAFSKLFDENSIMNFKVITSSFRTIIGLSGLFFP